MFEQLLRLIKKIIPELLFRALQPAYHFLMAFLAALVYRFPSRKIRIVGVTGTKGKSTVTELITSILEENGNKVALSNTIKFKIGDESERNLHKMTMPGRFFVQAFLSRATKANCDWVVLEMTSEGVRQFRHKFIALDGLVFTNLSPEHIEAHGSFEKYRDAKRKIGRALEKSSKKEKVVVANADDKEGAWYLGLEVETSVPYSLSHAEPSTKKESGYTFTFRNTLIDLNLPGEFNLYNALAASSFAASQNIKPATIKRGIENVKSIRGRVEFVQKEPFAVVVDYAHTIDSLEQFYGVFRSGKNICILGNTGGGRDAWKRPKMASVAEKHCAHVILTNEDPYDEDPKRIVEQMASGIKDKDKLEIIMDRREAISEALKRASAGDNILITGKGTDPFIMGPNGTRKEWDDARIAREELEKMS